MNGHRLAPARDLQFPVFDRCSVRLKIRGQIVKPLRGRLIGSLFEAIGEIVMRNALIVERRLQRLVAGGGKEQR